MTLVTPLVTPFAELLGGSPVSFRPGDLVENFGQVARVMAVDPERGLLLRPCVCRGLVVCSVTENRDGGRWYADPAKCRPVL